MTERNNIFAKIVSVLLCVLLVLALAPFALFTGVSASKTDTRVVDPSTMDGWRQIFLSENLNTENAGRIWTDKSVFTDSTAFTDAVQMEDPKENFLVALSAVSASKAVTGYSQVPTDTMFVLDVSRSMGGNIQAGDNNNNAVQELVDSTNEAMAGLLDANNYNRVGVVLYSGTYSADTQADASNAVVLLPLGRYEHAQGEFLVKDNHIFSVGDFSYSAESVKVNSQVTCNDEVVQEIEREVFGGSFTQGGVYAAMEEFLAIEDTTVKNETFQSGTKRLPVTILMSDGVATSATTAYMGDGEQIGTADMGDGSTPEDELASAIPFVTQLTCAYAKARVSEHYGRDALFYTIGYNVESTPVLDPESSEMTHTHWDTYNVTQAGGFMQLAVKSTYVSNGWWGEGHWDTEYKAVEKCDYALEEHYVDEYYEAQDDLSAAFEHITNEIIEESLYYPTQVDNGNTDLDGYVEFIDDIGQFMEVKKVQGILLGDVLFTGNNIASNFVGDGGKLGTIENPSNLGDEMIRAVKARLGIAETADAQKLVNDAYLAGQLAYDIETGEYSNYIGWYADAQGEYICHGTRNDETTPEDAVFYNESYGYLGDVTDGHNKTDMMYVSVQVHKRIATGTSAVIFRVPASLIPMIQYNVTLTGNSLVNPGEVTVSVDDTMGVDSDEDGVIDSAMPITPIRLVFEVGLVDEINELNVSQVVPDSYKYVQNGEYTFYTNRWNAQDIDHEHPSKAENTVSFYEPSAENERYYYTENTTVLRKSAEEYVPYKGAQSPAQTTEPLYRAIPVFETVNDNEISNGRLHLHYEQISEEALALTKPSAETADDDTTWFVPKGTVHHMYDNLHRGKGGFTNEEHSQSEENLTGSLIYSHFLRVEPTSDGKSYYADVILGNNGKMTLSQAQGVKISAQTDITMQGAEEVFTFEVEADAELFGKYRLLKEDAYGVQTEQEAEFDSGVLRVELAAGECAYVLGIPEGTNLTVRELTEGASYKVSTVNGEEKAEFTAFVAANSMIGAEFVNTMVPRAGYAAIVLWSRVSHPFSENYEIPQNIEFTYNVEYADASGNTQSKEISLPAGRTMHVTDIPLGATVTVKASRVPAGFDSELAEQEKTFVADAEKYYVVSVDNVYTPSKVSPVINLTGEKALFGRQDAQWLDSDKFTFVLQKYENGEFADLAQALATKESKTFDFSSAISAESYSQVGVYTYRVLEVTEENPQSGITFDKNVRWFDVFVTDKDMDGSLEIDSVVPYGGTTANKVEGSDEWQIKTKFTNTYSIAGSDTVKVLVRNEITDNTTGIGEATALSKAGYEYGLYQGEKLVTLLPATNEQGETLVTLSYGSFDIGKHIHYVLRQMTPEEPLKGMEYSKQEYTVSVEIQDDNKGGINAYLIVGENGSSETPSTGDEVSVVFENTYGEKAEQPTTAPQASEPESSKPSEPLAEVPEPSTDATGTEETQKGDVSDMPQTGLIGIINTGLWYLLLVVIVAGILGAVFIGRKKK
ncbi:MAG: hypothetical protein IJA62_07065 [Ruminococcus sp.]|nr:hypothetical protein [Ruminococcus sp.]